LEKAAYAETPDAEDAAEDEGWEEIERNWALFSAVSDTLDGHYRDNALSGVF